MTLARLLEINRTMVRAEAERSLHLAERFWTANGSPTEPLELVDVLEEVLDHCVQRGIRYAPILLLRKKTLEIGAWKPRVTEEPPPKQSNGVCTRCAGLGTYVARGKGHLCSCGAWRNWGGRPVPATAQT